MFQNMCLFREERKPRFRRNDYNFYVCFRVSQGSAFKIEKK